MFCLALIAFDVNYLPDLSMEYLIGLLKQKTEVKGEPVKGPVTYIGLDAPEGLPEGSKVYTLSNLHELIP